MAGLFPTGYVKHMMLSMLSFELSTCFLNPREILRLLLGKAGASRSTTFQLLTYAFGATFLLNRIGFGLPRMLAHALATWDNIQTGRTAGWVDGCTGGKPMVVAMVTMPLQATLNIYWAVLIIKIARAKPHSLDRDRDRDE